MHAPRRPGMADRFHALKSSRPITRPAARKTSPHRPGKPPLAMRRYQIKALMPDGRLREAEHIGPARPDFEAAFAAFAHGTLICTPDGQIAVEDLLPGMQVQTAAYGDQDILWIGSMTLLPRAAGLPNGACLTRIVTDGFGLGRPGRDLLMGPAARILQSGFGTAPILIPAHQMVDGLHAVEVTPPRPVTVYHICLRHHAVINANGLNSESFHPGTAADLPMRGPLLDLFLSFFPHVRTLEDFGPLAHPRRAFETPLSEPA
jgi:hypothetical protein